MNNQIKNSKLVLFVILFYSVIFLCLSTNSFAQHRKYTESDMPKAVMDTFHKLYPNAMATGFDMEHENGITYFELESTEGSINRDFLFYEDGTIAEIEESILPDDLPDDVKNAISNKYPGKIILKAEKVTKGKSVVYDVEIKAKKKKRDLVIGTDGSIISDNKIKK